MDGWMRKKLDNLEPDVEDAINKGQACALDLMQQRMASEGAKLPRTRRLALIALFAAIHGSLAAVPGIWGPSEVARSFVIFIEPLEGILLGPAAGFASASIGCVLGRIMRPREEGFVLGVAFGMGEAVAAIMAGLMFKKKWSLVLVIYSAMLAAFLADPLTWSTPLPLWTIWDTFLALFAIFPAHIAVRRALADRKGAERLCAAVALTTFVSTEADMLFRIFLLIPLKFYTLYPIPVEVLPAVFMLGAVVTPIEAVLSTLVTTVLAVPVLLSIERSKAMSWPIT